MINVSFKNILALTLIILYTNCQILDTMRDPNISASDSINKIIRTKALIDGVQITLMSPRRVNRKGVRVRFGTSFYYLHVLKAKEIFVEQEPLKITGKRTYILVSSPLQILPYRLPDSLVLRAQYIKGMVDNLDSLIRAGRKKIRRLKREIDSLKIVSGQANIWIKLRRLFLKRTKMDTLSPQQRDSIKIEIKKKKAQIRIIKKDIKIYRKFRRKKGGRSAPKFFTRHYFRAGLKYDVYGEIYGLPTFVKEHVWQQTIAKRGHRKKIPPPKRKRIKLQIILKKKGVNWEKK